MRNITKQLPENMLSQLREANENLVIASIKAAEMQTRAESANQRQNEFLSMLAHELRNPLAPIGLAAEMLDKIAVANPQLPQLTSIQHVIGRQISHMKRLLDDLLDASRVTTGKFTLVHNPVLLSDVIQNASEIAQSSLESQCQTLSVSLPAQPVTINGDAVRLAQVFSNLLINASKYSRQADPISVTASIVREGEITVSVKDQGVGIEAEIKPFIFDVFAQGPRTLDRSQGGLGIGLSMVRVLVQMHGGTVKVCSDGRDQGSEFIVVLPLCKEAASAQFNPVKPSPASRPSRILIIEDNKDGNDTLNFCLTIEGHEVDSAYDGTHGLALARAGHYDLIFCDIGLPGVDGYEVVAQVRQHCLEPVPYCVAMTGYDQQNYRERALHAGFDQFLIKPVSLDKLLDVVAVHTSRSLLQDDDGSA